MITMDPLRPNHFYNLPDELQHKIMMMRPAQPVAMIIKTMVRRYEYHYPGMFIASPPPFHQFALEDGGAVVWSDSESDSGDDY